MDPQNIAFEFDSVMKKKMWSVIFVRQLVRFEKCCFAGGTSENEKR
jgi:hypothetical protein